MTDLLRAEVIEALAKKVQARCSFAAAEAVRSFDLSPYRVTVPEDIKPIALLHDDGYWTWKGNPLEEPMKGFLPIRVYPHEVVESLAAQLQQTKGLLKNAEDCDHKIFDEWQSDPESPAAQVAEYKRRIVELETDSAVLEVLLKKGLVRMKQEQIVRFDPDTVISWIEHGDRKEMDISNDAAARIAELEGKK